MPQWRKLHVKATESLDINDMPDDFHRLLWIMLPLGLDREGCGLDNPAWIKAKIMPLRLDVTHEMIEAAMQWYTSRGMVLRYQVEGRSYFWLRSFKTYQGNTEREGESSYPPPPELLTSYSGPTHELVMDDSCLDVDVDVDVDSEVDVDADVDAPAATRAAMASVFRAYESEIGPLTPMISEDLMLLVAEHPPNWVIAAMREASANGKRNLAYFRAILRRWKVDGYGVKQPGKGGNGPDPPVDPWDAALSKL